MYRLYCRARKWRPDVSSMRERRSRLFRRARAVVYAARLLSPGDQAKCAASAMANAAKWRGSRNIERTREGEERRKEAAEAGTQRRALQPLHAHQKKAISLLIIIMRGAVRAFRAPFLFSLRPLMAFLRSERRESDNNNRNIMTYVLRKCLFDKQSVIAIYHCRRDRVSSLRRGGVSRRCCSLFLLARKVHRTVESGAGAGEAGSRHSCDRWHIATSRPDDIISPCR